MTLGPLMIDLAGITLTGDDRRLLKHPAVGGVILFSRNFDTLEPLRELTTEIHALRRPPLLIAVDQEGGRVQRFHDPFTRLPPARNFGYVYDADADQGLALARSSGWLMAAELRACGIDMSFAPVVDLDRGLCRVIGDRACHNDPVVVAKLARAYIDGMHTGGMVATAKHFPGHGAVAGDSHLTLPVDKRDLALLDQDMTPFAMLINNGLDAVMMALVSYSSVDEAPASLSRRWIREQLRTRLGFSGAVFSDDLSMAGAAGAGNMLTRVRTAMTAGCDMVLICNDRAAVEGFIDKVEMHGPAAQARLASLHGRRAPGWNALHRSDDWKKIRKLVMTAFDIPGLQLDGD